jgi:hypothetical protein
MKVEVTFISLIAFGLSNDQTTHNHPAIS